MQFKTGPGEKETRQLVGEVANLGEVHVPFQTSQIQRHHYFSNFWGFFLDPSPPPTVMFRGVPHIMSERDFIPFPCAYWIKRHDVAAVLTVASQQEGHKFDPGASGAFMLSLWLRGGLTRCSCFLPQSKNTHVRPTGTSTLLWILSFVFL